MATHEVNVEVIRHIRELLTCLNEEESKYRAMKLERAWWSEVTPIWIQKIAVEIFLKVTEQFERCEGSNLCVVPSVTSTESSLVAYEGDAQTLPPSEELIAAGVCTVSESIDLEGDLGQRLLAASEIQESLTPLLVRFWQSVPHQLRQILKRQVVETLEIRMSELANWCTDSERTDPIASSKHRDAQLEQLAEHGNPPEFPIPESIELADYPDLKVAVMGFADSGIALNPSQSFGNALGR